MGPLGESLLAWVWLPVLVLVLCLGIGLLMARLLRVDLPAGLLAPVGFCGAIVLVMPAYRLHIGREVNFGLLVLAAAAGLALSRPLLPRLAWIRWPLLAGALVFALYLAPVVFSGGWTWTGYNFVNDTATQLALTDHIGEHGIQKPIERLETEEELESTPTSVAVIFFYLRAAYPVGAHAFLASVSTGTGVPLAALYAPFIAVMVGLAAMAFAALASRWVDRRLAVLVAVAAVASNLTYSYAQQGNIKEMALLACLAAAAGVAGELPRVSRYTGPAIMLAVCLGAMLSVFGAAGAPFAVAAGGAAVVGTLVLTGRDAVRSLAPSFAAGALTVAGIALVSATGLLLSLRELTGTFASAATPEDGVGAVAPVSELGHLLRPLPLSQVAGVWLSMDYRGPVPPERETLNAVLIGLVFVLFAVGVAWLVGRRALGPLVLLTVAAATVAFVSPRVSPYAGAKVLALASPAVVMVAAAGVVAIGRHWRVAGIVLGGVAFGGLVVSDAYTYHGVKLAPVERLEALEQVGDHYGRPEVVARSAPRRGRVLFAENEEFGKYLLRHAFDVDEFDSVSPLQALLKEPQSPVGRHFDLDDHQLPFLQAFDWIVQRRGPTASRPPANFIPDFGNRFYQGWRRTERPRIIEHLGLQEPDQPAAEPSCRKVRALAERAETGQVLLAAPRPRLVKLDTAVSPRSPGWRPHPYVPDTVTTTTPGSAEAPVFFPGGRYRVWLRGSFGRAIHAFVDGREVGVAAGVDNPGQWHALGELTVPRGRHQLELRRDGGDLRPGDGFVGELGPLAFEPVVDHALVRVAPREYRRLCGRSLDWIERVSP